MMDSASMPKKGLSSIVEEFAVCLMCWRMRLSMLEYLTYQKQQLMIQQSLLQKPIMILINEVPDEILIEDEEDEYYE